MSFLNNQVKEQGKKQKREGSVEIYGAENVQGKKMENGKCFLYVSWVTDDKEIFTWEPVDKFENGCDLLDMLDEYDRFENRNFRRDYTDFLIDNYRGNQNTIIRPRPTDPIEVFVPKKRTPPTRRPRKRPPHSSGILAEEQACIDHPEDLFGDESQFMSESVFPSANFLNRLLRPKPQRHLRSVLSAMEKKYSKRIEGQSNRIVPLETVSIPEKGDQEFQVDSQSPDEKSISLSIPKEPSTKPKKSRSSSKRKKAKNKRRGQVYKNGGEGPTGTNSKANEQRVELESPKQSGSKKRFHSGRKNLYLTPVKKEEDMKEISSQKKTFYNSNLKSYDKCQIGSGRKDFNRSMRDFSMLSNKSSSLLRESVLIKDDPNLTGSERENQIQLIQDRALIGKRRNTKNKTFTSDHKKDRRRRKKVKRTLSGRKNNFFVDLNDRMPFEYKQGSGMLFRRKSKPKPKPELIMKNPNKFLFNVESLSETPNDEEIQKFKSIFKKCRIK